jgi:hypothetical protein
MNLSGMMRNVRLHVVAVLIPLLIGGSTLSAQNHVVSPAELKKAMLDSGAARQRNLESMQTFAASAPVQKAFSASGISQSRFQAAVSSLNDEELARFASRAQSTQADFAAGRLTERDLLIILVGFAALILIIVAVR